MTRAEELVESWDGLFDPRSVAVVGASNVPGKWGFIIALNLVGGGYRGELFMVNPRERSIHGLPTVKNLREIGRPVDLIIVTVPASLVWEVVTEAEEIGTKNMVVISSGFSEMSSEGRALEEKLAERAHGAGIRLIGPNTMGICSPPTRLFALGATHHPPSGHIAFVSQSGNLGVQLLGWAARSGLGISRFIGSGNEAVVTCDQILEYYGADPQTRVIIMYLEGIDRGAQFLEVARRITPHKPVIALKMGATEEGAKAASSHSGAVSTPHRVYQAMVRQAGIIEAASTEEMVNLARSFGNLPIPKGRRVGIMTMGGGWGVVTSEVCARQGLKLPPPSPATIEEINQLLPKFWSHGNPVDLVGTIRRSAHYEVLEAMVRDPNFDSIITLGSLTGLQYDRSYSRLKTLNKMGFQLLRRHKWNIWKFYRSVYQGFKKSLASSEKEAARSAVRAGQSGGLDVREARKWNDEVFAQEIKNLMRASGKPIIPVPFDPTSVPEIYRRLGLVAFGIPEQAAGALAKLTEYHNFLERHRREQEREDRSAPTEDTAVAISATLKGPARTLTERESKEILTHFGIPVTREWLTSTEEEAVARARQIGFPVAVKIESPDLPHKSDAGGVIVGLTDENGVRSAFRQVTQNARNYAPTARIEGVLVQEMVTGGTEVLIGVSRDPCFGQTIVFGLGGILVEVLDDVALRILPIELPDAEAMIHEIKGRKILAGVRGQKPRDVAALAETIRRVGELAYNLRDRIIEMDVNPLVVFEEGKGVKVLDALIVVSEGKSA